MRVPGTFALIYDCAVTVLLRLLTVAVVLCLWALGLAVVLVDG